MYGCFWSTRVVEQVREKTDQEKNQWACLTKFL